MVTFRELINGTILNEAKWIGFMGDSEFINKDGEIVMGYWVFVDIIKENTTSLTLDSEIEELEPMGKEYIYILKNDNGITCMIKLLY